MNFSVMGGLLDLQRDKKVEDFILYNLITKSTFKKKKGMAFLDIHEIKNEPIE